MPRISARSTRLLAATAALLLLTAACSGGGDDDPQPKGDSESTAVEHTGREGDGWTVLHYSMADTNLEPFMVADVNELGVVGSNDNLHIRELMDRSAEYGDDELLDQGSWVGARVLDLGEPGVTEVVEDLGDVDSRAVTTACWTSPRSPTPSPPGSSRPEWTSSTCWASTLA